MKINTIDDFFKRLKSKKQYFLDDRYDVLIDILFLCLTCNDLKEVFDEILKYERWCYCLCMSIGAHKYFISGLKSQQYIKEVVKRKPTLKQYFIDKGLINE